MPTPQSIQAQTYQGSCQCGAVRFTAHVALQSPFQCNCSRCRRLNAVMHAVPAADFTLVAGQEALATYRFNSHTIAHQFCTRCGIQPFASGIDGNGDKMHVINVHCLQDAQYDEAAVTVFDGAAF